MGKLSSMATLNSCPKCGGGNRDLYSIAALFWLVSLTRVVIALVQHEVFGVEASLACIFVVGVPWALAPRLGMANSMRVR